MNRKGSFAFAPPQIRQPWSSIADTSTIHVNSEDNASHALLFNPVNSTSYPMGPRCHSRLKLKDIKVRPAAYSKPVKWTPKVIFFLYQVPYSTISILETKKKMKIRVRFPGTAHAGGRISMIFTTTVDSSQFPSGIGVPHSAFPYHAYLRLPSHARRIRIG